MLHPAPKPPRKVKIKKRLRARREPKAFQHRRVPEYKVWIGSYACLLHSMECSNRIGIFGSECAHVKSRGAGGDDVANCVPLCTLHHQEQHRIGIRSFQKKYNLDLYAIAADLGRIYAKRKTKSGA